MYLNTKFKIPSMEENIVVKRKRIIIKVEDEDELTVPNVPDVTRIPDKTISTEEDAEKPLLREFSSYTVFQAVNSQVSLSEVEKFNSCFANNDIRKGFFDDSEIIFEHTFSLENWNSFEFNFENVAVYKRYGDPNTWGFFRKNKILSTITYLFQFKDGEYRKNQVMITVNKSSDRIQHIYPAFITAAEDASFLLKQIILIAIAEAFNSFSRSVLIYVDQTVPFKRGLLAKFASLHLKFFRPRGGSNYCIFLCDLLSQAFNK